MKQHSMQQSLKPLKIFYLAIFLSLLAPRLSACASASDALNEEKCQLCMLELKAGMSREEVETKVANLLGKENNYSLYGNNLQGGVVLYEETGWELKITYRAGTPAPWIINQNGVAEHYPPIDETLLHYEIFRKHLPLTR